jgi:hypothetical protein
VVVVTHLYSAGLVLLWLCCHLRWDRGVAGLVALVGLVMVWLVWLLFTMGRQHSRIGGGGGCRRH